MSAVAGLQVECAARVGELRIDVGFDTAPGTLVIVGPNGAGKSSLLSLVFGAHAVERGRISIGDEVLLDTERGVDVPLEHRRLGFVPQDYALFPHLTVRQNIDFAIASALPRLSRSARAAQTEQALQQLGLASLADRRPATLSGGEKQRSALARALSVKPRALLLDEPLAALDVHSRAEVRAFLAGALRSAALPTVVVTHDPADARQLGDRIVVLEAGQITQAGRWDELTANPASRFVEKLVAST